MTTLLDYKTAVEAKGFEAPTPPSATIAAVNAARRRVVNARRWTFLEATDASLSTSYADGTVAVSDAWRIDAVRLSQGSASWDLEYLGPQEVRRLALADPTPGTPRYWSKHAGDLVLYPVPDGVYTVTVDYVIETVPALAADGDVDTVLPNSMVEVVAWAALRDISFRLRDYNSVGFADGEYQTLLAALIRDDNTPQRQASRQVVSNPNRWAR